MTTLGELGEDALIEKLVALVPREDGPAAGPGDDCAVVDDGGDVLTLLKTDALVEGVHYTADAPAEAVGWKAVARVVSDFAAMGGRARRFLVTVALPGGTEVEWAEGLYRGIGRCLVEFGAVLAGGETSSVPDGSAAVISVAATGEVDRRNLVLRSGGKPGDVVLVTGRLGGSLAGKHLSFVPRVREAGWLAGCFKPRAMMDLSDGLAKDLPRMAAASGCGFVLDAGAVPCTDGCGVEAALSDGEDFELLLAVDADRVDALTAGWHAEFPDLELTAVGRLVERGEGGVLDGGWDHFRRQDG
ncbi:MAG: thiamine-phosphate kinase [Verrucomicrobiota bacterium JB025]|nr:thiamine-phosphate kinase [Verrucomicrobiota bacterium JB025]